ncbi:hypothetical protein GCM10027570_40440 [Streptomonospora sediminis]
MTANELFAAQQQALAQQFHNQPAAPDAGAWPQQPQQAQQFPQLQPQQHPQALPPQQPAGQTGQYAWPQQPPAPSPAPEPAPAAPAAPAAQPDQVPAAAPAAAPEPEPADTAGPAESEQPQPQPQSPIARAASVELVTSTLAGLAMRDLALVDSLIEVVEDLEDSSEDPELLERLFKIDNLATRMRRNSENLLVLADQDSGDPSAEPVPLLDVARAAISEIKDYQRVQVGRLPQIYVAGTAADDLSHLLAELMDNATGKSPEHAQVVVTGQYMADGQRLLLTVQDEGIGIPDDQLANLNERLRGEPVLDEEVMRHMGLYVVSNIAHRHRMEVQLEARAFRGLSAHVMLDSELVSTTGPAPAAPEPAPRPVAPPTPRRPAPESGRGPSAPVSDTQEDRSAMEPTTVTPAGLPRRSAHRGASPMMAAEPWDSAEDPAGRTDQSEHTGDSGDAPPVDRAARIRDDLAGFVEGEQEAARTDEPS